MSNKLTIDDSSENFTSNPLNPIPGGGGSRSPPLRFFADSVKTGALRAAKFGDFIRTFIAHLFVFEILNLLK